MSYEGDDCSAPCVRRQLWATASSEVSSLIQAAGLFISVMEEKPCSTHPKLLFPETLP